MLKKPLFFKTFAFALLLSFAVSLLPVAVFAEAEALSATSVKVFNAKEGQSAYLPSLSVISPDRVAQDHNQIIMVAQNTTAQPAAAASGKVENRNCCGDFWDIHFGGYRWAWWALAGAGLIAIHAN